MKKNFIKTINRDEKINFPIYFIGLFLIFVFLDNHNALFIADYYWFLILFVATFCVFMIKYNYKINFGIQHYTILFLFCLLIVTSIVNFKNIDKGTLLSYLVWFGFYFFAVSLSVNKKDINLIINCFIIGALICALLVIFMQFDYIVGDNRFTIKIGNNEKIDPNYLCEFLIIGGTFALSKICIGKKKLLLKLIYTVFFLIITYAIIMTGSRAGFLAYGLGFLGVLLKLIIDNKQKISMLHTILILLILISLISIILIIMPDKLLARFNSITIINDSNLLRFAHWKAAIYAWLEHPIFGYGATHTKDILNAIMGHPFDAHNTYLTFLLHFGIVGLIAFIIIFIDIVKKLWNKEGIVFLFVLLAQSFCSLIIANHLGISLWMTVLLCYYVGSNTQKNTPKIAIELKKSYVKERKKIMKPKLKVAMINKSRGVKI